MIEMDPEALRRFARRDWAAVARAKRDYWAAQYRERGSGPASRAAWQLLQHARSLHPGYPAPADRAIDFEHHLDVCDRLDRAARAIARR
jgi:hypothetical protein